MAIWTLKSVLAVVVECIKESCVFSHSMKVSTNDAIVHLNGSRPFSFWIHYYRYESAASDERNTSQILTSMMKSTPAFTSMSILVRSSSWVLTAAPTINCFLKHTHPFNGPLSRTTRVGRYQKGKTHLDFTVAIESEWQWHQLGLMQVCTLLQTDNHANTPPLSFLQAGCLSCRPTSSFKAHKAKMSHPLFSNWWIFHM